MPLTDKGETTLESMKREYGDKKGEEVFYASRNKGTITGVDAATETVIKSQGRIQLVQLANGRFGFRVGSRTEEFKTRSLAEATYDQYLKDLRGDSMITMADATSAFDELAAKVKDMKARADEVSKRIDAAPKDEPTKWRFYFSVGGKGKSNRQTVYVDVNGKLSPALDKAQAMARKQWPDATAIIHERSVALN